MKFIQFYFFVVFFCSSFWINAQSDSITVLDEVLLTDTRLKGFSTGQNIQTLVDTTLQKNGALLTDALNFNTPVYFKENGLGMVSSPSFRGTSASQTAVLWNGININSQFNGQIDFNTINTGGYDNISVRGGGGSVVYGSGAIGGSIHLNTHLGFEDKTRNTVFLQYGSYNTLDARYKLKTSGEKWSLSLALARNSSDNDYELPGERGKNQNGNFYNTGLDLGLAYRLDSKNILKLYAEIFDGERHFSLIRSSETRTKYQDFNSRNLLEWQNKSGKFTSTTRLAYLDENYRYYDNIENDDYSLGNAKSFIAKYDLAVELEENLELGTVLTNTYTDGEGSGLAGETRNIFSAAVLMKHRPWEKLQYELGFRKEATNSYESPFLYSLSGSYDFSEVYTLKFNASKNFRIPTYNDLYWNDAGNPDLRPEFSRQFEISQDLSFNNFSASLTGYFIDIEDMIRWLPASSGNWEPINEDEVHSYGAEVFLNYGLKLRKHHFKLNGTYAYTVSEDAETGNQLIYVPFHKATGSFDYSFKNWSANWQGLFTGEVFTRSDNNSRYNLEKYWVNNFSVAYQFKKWFKLGGRLRNLFDKEYMSVENRWMPGRNYSIFLNLNF